MTALIHYESTINRFFTEDAMAVLDCTFQLSREEKKEIRNILDQYYQPLTGPMKQCQQNIKDLKDICEHDWEAYMKDKRISELHHTLGRLLCPRNPRNITLFHTITRLGEFFYMTDNEMNSMASNMDSFIEAGDCKLFDNDNSPYPDEELTDSLEEDIIKFEKDIRRYLKKNDLPDITASQIQEALDTIKEWVNSPALDQIPKEARGMIQLCQEIKRDVCKESRRLHWDYPGCGGIDPEFIMKKMSGFCLNKEPFFQDFLFKAKMAGWKNPEGSWFYGESKYPWNPQYFQDMSKLEFWDMDVIYYSLGKGPWLKCRYVGQPCAFYQNVAEPLANVVKKCIKSHHERWKQGKEGVLDAEGLNIYENYNYLLDMVRNMVDSIAMDFKAYSDYLSRNSFKWVMKYLWGVPDSYAKEIYHLMSLPIKVNGKIYPHKHASVMGIKVNFLLITFSNFLMWMVGCIISGAWDRPKFMGDDRIQVILRPYLQQEVDISFAATAYFNCVVNSSKSEWMQRDKITSFCKRTFLQDGTQVSGFSGEYILKQKPFLNDVSVWLNTCEKNGVPICEEQRDMWVEYHAKYYAITNNRFHSPKDPPFEDMVRILMKVPYCYGGWSLSQPDSTLEEIMLRSVLNTIAVILKEAYEERKVTNRFLVREYILANSSESNRYYQNLLHTNTYTLDMEKISEYMQDIVKVLDSQVNTVDDIKLARIASQRLMEIVLDRDSRLVSSSSTKNRVNFSFDQDRVSKIRAKYIQIAAKEKEKKLKSDALDYNILMSMIKHDYKQGIYDYFDYLNLRNENRCCICIYTDCYSQLYYGMSVVRMNKDGSFVRVKKRLDTFDSYYDRAYYSEKSGKWFGNFVIYDDLTEGEKKIFDILNQTYTRKAIEQSSRALNEFSANALLAIAEALEELSGSNEEDLGILDDNYDLDEDEKDYDNLLDDGYDYF